MVRFRHENFVLHNLHGSDAPPETDAPPEHCRQSADKTTDPALFHMSHAKNMAHRMATGDIVCNLDADNFTGPGFAQFLKEDFEQDINVIVNPSFRVSRLFKPEERGFGGRVALSKENFLALGGYDENFKGWGGEDNDFTLRAKGFGLKHLRIEDLRFLKIIKHSNYDRVVNMAAAPDLPKELQHVNFLQHGESHLSKIWRRVEKLVRPVQSNTEGHLGMGTVTMADGQVLHLGKVQNEILSPFHVCALGLPELVRGRFAPRISHPNSAEESKTAGLEHHMFY